MSPTASSILSTEMAKQLGQGKGGELGAKKAAASSTPASSSSSSPVSVEEVAAPAAEEARWPRVYWCMYCPRTFRTPQALGGHQNGHRPQREKAKNPPRLPWQPWDPSRYLYTPALPFVSSSGYLPRTPSIVSTAGYHQQRTPSNPNMTQPRTSTTPNIPAGYYTPSTPIIATGYLARTHIIDAPAGGFPPSTLTLFPETPAAAAGSSGEGGQDEEEPANRMDLVLKL